MNEGVPNGYSAASKRLLGLRDFNIFSPEEKTALLVSKDRLSALEAIDTNTMPRGPKREMKRGIVLEVLKQKLLSVEILRNNPLVYLGSGFDVEYPLALGAHKIIMVDPIFSEEDACEEVRSRIEDLGLSGVTRDNKTITFEFNFGDGHESVSVDLIPEEYPMYAGETGYSIPETAGHIVLYASQGPEGIITVTDEMKSRVLAKGAILSDADLIRFDSNHHEERITLGN